MNEDGRISVVYDCMIYLQGLAHETGPAVECLRLFEDRVVSLAVSDEILDEVEDVLARPFLQAKFRHLTAERARDLVILLKARAHYFDRVPQVFDYPRDRNDEKYINLAIAANVDYLVSRDNDLLDLMTGHSDEAKAFRQRYRSIKVVSPVDFIHIIRVRALKA